MSDTSNTSYIRDTGYTSDAAGARPGRVAAIVLAAGFSSRMGAFKPLLPLGSTTAIERAIGSLRAAGVADIVVVTGHSADEIAPLIDRLGVRRAHNAGFVDGMFSSVRTGVAGLRGDGALPPDAALPGGLDAFLILPVDCPLVTPSALRRLIAGFEPGGPGILYPTCLGRRGHPPLLATRYAPLLLAADAGGNLQAFLGAHPDDSAEVDVRDLTVLMDMDTPADYTSLSTFAAALDAATAGLPAGGSAGPEPTLTAADALYLLEAAGTPANIVRHCRTAAAVGEHVAAELHPRVPALDVDLVRAGCLLHDIARLLPHHATLAAEVLAALGLPRLAAVIGEHMIISPEYPAAPGISEAELVYLADKTVADGEVVGLDERQARTLRKMRPEPAVAERVAARIQDARTIAAKVTAVLGRPFEELLAEVEVPEAARRPGLDVYLVRHALPDIPPERRFLGRRDAPLSATGEEQARQLAAKLMRLTGGACFDTVYSSDLTRCLRTAELGKDGCDIPVTPLPWLREVDVGLWEGLSGDEVRERYPKEWRLRELDIANTPFPGGESFADVRDRVMPPLRRLLEQELAAGHRRIMVVAHAGVNRVILSTLRQTPLADLFSFEQDYCAVTLIRVAACEAGGWAVCSIEPR